MERLLPVAVQMVKEGRGAVSDCVLDAKVENAGSTELEGSRIAAEKGDTVVEEGAEVRGAGKAVLVG